MRLGVDVGGTFTDVVLEASQAASGDGFTSAKVLTTAKVPEQGVLAGIGAVLADAGVTPQDIGGVIHGTTLATNALIERRGAFTAFVTTAGFRDVIETRTESRFDQYDLNLMLPPPLVERRHRYGLLERMSANGEVLVPFDEAQARHLARKLKETGYESVAVGFLHSYRNPDHERRFRDVLREVFPEAAVSISAEVSSQMRELERFNTVCANAFVQPVMASYLHRLHDELHAIGVSCPVHIIHSGGGLMSLEAAAELPVRLVESGPAGGAIFAADIAARYGLDRVVSYDMGGTTAKICLIENSTPRTAKTFEVARTTRFAKGSGMSISIPVIEMIEIGAGGGSIADVDMLSQIRVGPRSAGASPGPACYGLGGDQPTVTDADLVLGRLSPDTFGAPEIDLDTAAARNALEASVGNRLGLDVADAAVGVSEVVDESMANAARVHAVENGQSLDRFTMIAFGGAAPLHAARLCAKLGVEQLLIPPGAGVGSAIGFLRAPFAYEAVRSHYCRLDNFDHQAIAALLAELTDEAESFVRAASNSGYNTASLPEPRRVSRVGQIDGVGVGQVGRAGVSQVSRVGQADGVGVSQVSGVGQADRVGVGRVGRVDEMGVGQVMGVGRADRVDVNQVSRVGRVNSQVDIERCVYMRYEGQGWEIPVELTADAVDASRAELLEIEFTKAYEEFFGRAIAGLAVEAVSWSVRASVPQSAGESVEMIAQTGDVRSTRTRSIFDTATMQISDTQILQRAALSPGQRVVGPAVIVEDQTTTVVPSTHCAVAQNDGCLLVQPLRKLAVGMS